MKDIIIETVKNGWIVTERFACRNVADNPMAVYNRIEDLQAALPALLGSDTSTVAPPLCKDL